MKAAFKANGIEFARREVRVAIPGLEGAEDLTKQQKVQIAGAATSVAQNLAAPAEDPK